MAIVSVTLPIEQFLQYIDLQATEKACRQCSNYGRKWCCPPFENPIDFAQYSTITISMLKIAVLPNIPLQNAMQILAPYKNEIDNYLLGKESSNSVAFLCTSQCDKCEVCSRLEGKPCRYKESVRPSLEAMGVDVCRVCKELFNTTIVWSNGKFLPEYLVLVGAVLSK